MIIGLVFLHCVALSVFGQNEEKPAEIIPPSPNAASLGQYGDVPVSKYTGVPSISIPLYTIRSGEMKLPVSKTPSWTTYNITRTTSISEQLINKQNRNVIFNANASREPSIIRIHNIESKMIKLLAYDYDYLYSK